MKKILGIISILVFALGLVFAACDSGDDNDDPQPTPDVQDKTDVKDDGDMTIPDDPDVVDTPDDEVTVCQPQCEGKECGTDGCDGTCGQCDPGIPCMNGKCDCPIDCDGKECGPNGCGGVCGDCVELHGEGWTCNLMQAQCEPPCVPDCEGKVCGPDTCGGSCGTCPCDGCDPEETECNEGVCDKPEAETCSLILDCYDTCPEGDQACYQNCVNSAPIDIQMAYQNLIMCLDQAGYFKCMDYYPEDTPEWEDCLNEAYDQCTDEHYACWPPGDGSCVDMYLCIISCPGGDAGQECAQDCFGEASLKALELWDVFIDCLDENGYFDCAEGDEACYQASWDACDAEFKECAHGDYTCQEIFACQETCAPTDQTCFLQCIVYGSIEAQSAFDDIVDCVIEQCGDNTTPECENQALQGPCSEVYNDCLGA